MTSTKEANKKEAMHGTDKMNETKITCQGLTLWCLVSTKRSHILFTAKFPEIPGTHLITSEGWKVKLAPPTRH